MGPHASADARAVLDAIRRIVRLLRQSARAAERRTGMSAAQLFVFQQLRSAGGALTPGELAERTLTHQSSVSVVARRLVDGGLVKRQRSPADGRRVELSLTPAGRAAVRRRPRLAWPRRIHLRPLHRHQRPFRRGGPIIATGGAVGSLVGQLLHTTAVERKTLLAAGAAAGMDLLAAHRRRLDETHVTEQNLSWWPRG